MVVFGIQFYDMEYMGYKGLLYGVYGMGHIYGLYDMWVYVMVPKL